MQKQYSIYFTAIWWSNYSLKYLFFLIYSDKDDAILDWEYLPPVGPRPANGFVGLKNAGATCYMNSVLQQLFMIESVRNGVLEAEEACNDPDEDFSSEDRDEINENDNNAAGGEVGLIFNNTFPDFFFLF